MDTKYLLSLQDKWAEYKAAGRWQRLRKSDLKPETQTLICAARECKIDNTYSWTYQMQKLFSDKG